MSHKPSIFSERHPARLYFRAILLVLASPALILMGVGMLSEDPGRGGMGIVFGMLFGLVGGYHLWRARSGA